MKWDYKPLPMKYVGEDPETTKRIAAFNRAMIQIMARALAICAFACLLARMRYLYLATAIAVVNAVIAALSIKVASDAMEAP